MAIGEIASVDMIRQWNGNREVFNDREKTYQPRNLTLSPFCVVGRLERRHLTEGRGPIDMLDAKLSHDKVVTIGEV